MVADQPQGGPCGISFAHRSSAIQNSQAILTGRIGMKLAGFLLLLSGWIIVVSTLPLLPSLQTRAAFALAGMGVELIGLALVVRAHWVQKG
jgi:hypothetical protein